MKLFEKNIGQKLHGTGFSNDFLGMTPITQVITKYRQIEIHEN